MLRSYLSSLEDINAKNQLRLFYLENKLYKHVSIDIVMPTFNRAKTIEKSIKSVLEQSHSNWHLYVWDDGSTDNTMHSLNRYESDHRIHYFYSSKNKGVSYARNQCLKYCKSQIVTYLDSDNEWNADYLQMVCSFMVKFQLQCAYLGVKLVDESGIRGCLGQQFSWEDCLQENYIDLNCFAHTQKQLALMNRRWSYNFDETIQRLVDWDFILRITRDAKCDFLSLFLVNYYCGSQTARITNTVYKSRADLMNVIKFIQTKHE